MTCDVCSRKGETHVHALTSGAMSIASCVECIQNGAEPEWCFHYLYDWVGTKGEGLAEFVDHMYTYKDGEYITFATWREWRCSPGIVEELDMRHEAELESLNREEEKHRAEIAGNEGSVSDVQTDNGQEYWKELHQGNETC